MNKQEHQHHQSVSSSNVIIRNRIAQVLNENTELRNDVLQQFNIALTAAAGSRPLIDTIDRYAVNEQHQQAYNKAALLYRIIYCNPELKIQVEKEAGGPFLGDIPPLSPSLLKESFSGPKQQVISARPYHVFLMVGGVLGNIMCVTMDLPLILAVFCIAILCWGAYADDRWRAKQEETAQYSGSIKGCICFLSTSDIRNGNEETMNGGLCASCLGTAVCQV